VDYLIIPLLLVFKMVMSKEKFYGSALHFNTEASYDEYLAAVRDESLRKKRRVRVRAGINPRVRKVIKRFPKL